MSLSDGKLMNSEGDIIVDSVLLLLITVGNFLQISRLKSNGSIDGISPRYLLFNALFSNIQRADTLLHAGHGWPTDKNPVLKLIANGELRGRRTVGAVLGIVQVALQWMFSMVLNTLSAAYNSNSASSLSIPAIAFVHASLFLVPAVAITLPKPSSRRMDTDIFIGLSAIINTWLSLAFTLLQFPPQFLEHRRMNGQPGSLSLLALSVRAVATSAVAARWFQRLGPPAWEEGDARPPLTWRYRLEWLAMWYQWGWLPINYAVDGVGCALLVAIHLR